VKALNYICHYKFHTHSVWTACHMPVNLPQDTLGTCLKNISRSFYIFFSHYTVSDCSLLEDLYHLTIGHNFTSEYAGL